MRLPYGKQQELGVVSSGLKRAFLFCKEWIPESLFWEEPTRAVLTGSFWLTESLSPVRITPCSPQVTKQQSPQAQGSLQPSKTCALDLHPWSAFLCSCTVASSDLIRMSPFIPLSQTASSSPRAAHNLIYSWSSCPNTELLLLCLHKLGWPCTSLTTLLG